MTSPCASVNFASASISRYDIENQIGPRQFELPPLIFDVRLGRLIPDGSGAEAERRGGVALARGCACRRATGTRPRSTRAAACVSAAADPRSTAPRASVRRAPRGSTTARSGRGRFRTNQSSCRGRHRACSILAHSSTVTAKSGTRPTSERTRNFWNVARHDTAARRRRTRPRSSHSSYPRPPIFFIARADVDEVLEELRRHPFVDRVLIAPARSQSASCCRQKNPIHPVASDCSSIAPSGSARCDRRPRCCRARGTRPRRR